MKRLALISAVTLALCACGGERIEGVSVSASDRAVLQSALERAVADSAALAAATFSVPVRMETAFAEDADSVRVVETFRLSKTPGAEFTASEKKQEIHGNRELLKNMYSFENAKGELRQESEARFANVSFGSDQRSILRGLLAGELALVKPIGAAHAVEFAAEDLAGTIHLDAATRAVEKLAVEQTSSSIIGGYRYAMTLRFVELPSGVRIPHAMRTDFTFERLTSEGEGFVTTTIDTTSTAEGIQQ
jgi:hypothetical protein